MLINSNLIPFCPLEVSLGFPKSYGDFRLSLLSCKSSVVHPLSLHFAYIPQMLREWCITCIHFKILVESFLNLLFRNCTHDMAHLRSKDNPEELVLSSIICICGLDSVCESWRAVTLPTKSSLWSLKSFKLLLILSPC